ncbi:hypothetical protein SAMN02745165_00835 [Malonomonas rubra DSM 5091]|uniref:Uncharacterized protein n=1 Tax=Malonomonas rubra DSM 5091 TaxID=1122189 RepID=A0A1M6DWT5_MALRU|nr:hypothetical protein [Malonomonas rubra]SHI77635.1 hypothetical protein SAMN02745165_00835 [Malonomonas rubra DSM 5091]
MYETDKQQTMTEDMLRQMLEEAGAKTMSRSGRNEHYGSPREYSFEVKAIFPNSLGLQITARQYNYRNPWETTERVNDLVDVALLRNNQYCELPKGYPFYQDKDTEEEVDYQLLLEIIDAVKNINPKLFMLQELTGDL